MKRIFTFLVFVHPITPGLFGQADCLSREEKSPEEFKTALHTLCVFEARVHTECYLSCLFRSYSSKTASRSMHKKQRKELRPWRGELNRKLVVKKDRFRKTRMSSCVAQLKKGVVFPQGSCSVEARKRISEEAGRQGRFVSRFSLVLSSPTRTKYLLCLAVRFKSFKI